MIINAADILSKFKIEKKHLKQPSRKSRVVDHKKQGTLQEGEGIPSNIEGSDGDIAIRNVLGKGLFKYTKYKGGWYSQKLEGSNSQNAIINSNTTDNEILVYDENIKGFRNKIIKGDLNFYNGILSLKNDIISNLHLSENSVNTKQIKNGSIDRTHIIDNTLELSKFRDVTTVLEKNTFSMTDGSALNVSGTANAVGIITFTGVPSTGTQASGTINITETKKIISGSTLTIYDGNDNHTFYFIFSGETVTSDYDYKLVTIADTNVSTISNLRNSILNATDLLNVTIYNSNLGLQIQNKSFTANGNQSITQSSNIFTLTGMSSGANGGSFTIPNIENIDNKKFIFEPEITGSTKKSGNVINLNSDDSKIDYVTAKTDATTSATNLKNYIKDYGGTDVKGFGIKALNSSGAVTITQEKLVGASGNCTIVSNDANITVTQSMQGGVDKDAKYIIISRPLNGLTYLQQNGTICYDYVNTLVWFNVDDKLSLNADLDALRVDTSLRVDILSTDANTVVATKTKTELDSFYCTDYKGDEYLPFTSTVVSNNISIECTKPGISSGFSVGTSGTSISNVATGKINLNNAISSASTALSVGTNNTTELSITSDGGADDVTLPVATTSLTGVMNSAMFDTLAAATSNTGTVTSVAGAGTVNGLTLTGTVSTSGNLTLGGTLAINNGDWSGTALADGNIASASTWNSKQSQLTFGLNDTNSIVIDGGAANNQFAHFTASGIESLSYSSTKSKLDLDHLYTLVGAASDDAEHLGTFTGSTISDSQTIKQSLQALETAVESAGGGASSLNGLSDVTFSSNDLTIPGLDKIIFDGAVDYDLSGDVTFTENGAAFSFLTLDYNQEKITLKGNAGNTYLAATIFGAQATVTCDDVLRFCADKVDLTNSTLQMSAAGGVFGWAVGGSGSYAEQVIWNLTSNTYKFQNSSDSDDYFQFKVDSNAVTTLKTANDSGDTSANLVLDVDGDIELNADGGNITFKDNTADLAEISANGILSKTVVYFDAETANTIGNGATGVIDWTVNQKQKVTITGTGITCNFTNPPGPCNLILKVVQGDGSDVIGTWDSDIKWPTNGTVPTLSTGNGDIDILSFYWDGTNYFGVASLDFS